MNILNIFLKLVKKSATKGFTLVELVAVLGILVMLSTIVTGVLVYTFRLSAKSQITLTISQKGNETLTLVSNLLVNTNKVLSINGNPNVDNSVMGASQILLEATDNSNIRIVCETNNLKFERFPWDSSTQTVGAVPTVVPFFTTTQVQIKSNSCIMNYLRLPLESPQIELSFTLEQTNASALDENRASADFHTRISLRNF